MNFAALQKPMTGHLDPDSQVDWENIVDECALSINAICEDFKFYRQSFVKWLSCDRMPREKNRVRVIAAMHKIRDEKKIPWHPSFGYATTEQIEKLNRIGLCPERDYILKQIEKQNKTQGKRR